MTFNQIVVGSNPATLTLVTRTPWLLTNKLESINKNKTEWISLYLTFLKLQLGIRSFQIHSFKISWDLIKLSEFRKVGWDAAGVNQKYVTPLSKTHSSIRLNSTKFNHTSRIEISDSKFLWNSFIGFWGSSRPKSNLQYCTNRDFKLLFMSHSSDNYATSIISARRYFSRWVDANNLLFNLFYSGASVQMLSSNIFMEETLIFNWQYSSRNYKLFKYVQPYFIFKDFTHGGSVHSSMLMLFMRSLDVCIVVDVNNHKKLQGYLQKYNLYTIALVPINYSPWDVSYPIPSFSDSKLSQFYFLRWLFSIRSNAENLRYRNTLSIWLTPKN